MVEKSHTRITAEEYDNRLKKFKEQQNDVMFKMRRYDKADEKFYLTANQVLSLAQRAAEIFERSETHEKRQLVNFVFQNLKLNGKKLEYKLKTHYDRVLVANTSNDWSCTINDVRTKITQLKDGFNVYQNMHSLS